MTQNKFFILLSLIAVLFTGCDNDTNEPQGPVDPNKHYTLPVIFHVLYQDRNDPLQYVSAERFSHIIEKVNQLYSKGDKSVDMNLTFTLASTDPNGRELATPGVEYINMGSDYPIDYKLFMADNQTQGGKGYVKHLWDLNNYINIMVYNFASKPSERGVTLGISHIPFSVVGSHYLEGLTETTHSTLDLSNLAYPHCVSINSLFLNHISYGNEDIVITVAHEMGHYLGLYHVFFTEDTIALTPSQMADPDFCPDTKSYNRTKYDKHYDYIRTNEPRNFTFEYLSQREDINGVKFTSTNIMDYDVSLTDRFTADQLKRVRNVLDYSPLIPAKRTSAASRAEAPSGILDLPIRTME